MKINLVANPFGDSGYAIHSRGLASGMVEAGLDVGFEIVGGVPDKWQLSENLDFVKMVEKDNREQDFNILCTFPYQVQLKSRSLARNLPFCVWEADKLHSGWVWHLMRPYVDRILTPSMFTKEVCHASGITKPVHVIPHGVGEEFNADVQSDRSLYNPDVFTFLFVGGWAQGINDRKGLDILLKAYCEEFKKSEKVRLMVKINTTYDPNFNYLAAMRALPLLPKEERPEIMLITNPIKREAMPGIFKTANCLVMPSKGESFCFPCAEAMAVGVPAIATNYGGQTDYMEHDKTGWLINVKEMAKCTDGSFFYEESKWAIPDTEHLRKLMRYAFDNPKVCQLMGQEAAKVIDKEYRWKQSGEKVRKVLEEMVS